MCDAEDGADSMVLSRAKLRASKAGSSTPRGKVALTVLVQDDHTDNVKAKFKLLPAGRNIFPNTYKTTVRLKKYAGTDDPTGPVTVTLRQPTTSIDRADNISACTAKPGRLRCREQ